MSKIQSTHTKIEQLVFRELERRKLKKLTKKLIGKCMNYLAAGIKKLKVDYKKIQETITSISFVTKNNFDIEEQIADLFAYAARCKYFGQLGKKVKSGVYEKMMLKLLKDKIFKNPRNAKDQKMKYFEEVDSFLILP